MIQLHEYKRCFVKLPSTRSIIQSNGSSGNLQIGKADSDCCPGREGVRPMLSDQACRSSLKKETAEDPVRRPQRRGSNEPWREHGPWTWWQTWFANKVGGHGLRTRCVNMVCKTWRAWQVDMVCEQGAQTWSAKRGEHGRRTWFVNVAETVCSGPPTRVRISRRLLLSAFEALYVRLKTMQQCSFPFVTQFRNVLCQLTLIYIGSRHLVAICASL